MESLKFTPPSTPPDSPLASPRPSGMENKILFTDILRPFIDLLNRQVLVFAAAVKILKDFFDLICQIFYNSISKLFLGRTIPELKQEVLDAQNSHVISCGKMNELGQKFSDPSKFLEDLIFLRELKVGVQSNINRLVNGSPDLGVYSVQDIVCFYLSEDPINSVLTETLTKDRSLLGNLEKFLDDKKLLFILEAFKKFMKEAGEEKKKEILSTWQDVTSQIPSSLKSSQRAHLEATEREIRSFLKKEEAERVVCLEASAPSSRVGNIGFTCYIASVLQTVFAVPSLRRQIASPIPQPSGSQSSEEYHRKVAIQQALLNLMSASPPKNNGEEERYFLYSSSRHLLSQLREALHDSNGSELNRKNRGQQLDAAAVLELLSRLFFRNSSFEMRRTVRIDQYPTMEVRGRPEPGYILQIELDETRHEHQFTDLVNLFFAQRPATGMILDDREQEIHFNGQRPSLSFPVRIENYNVQYSLDQPPSVLLTHFKRFKNLEIQEADGTKKHERMKIGDKVELTKDGLFSLSLPQSQDTLVYQLKSFVVHDGELNGGHYTSYVEIQGKYYFCNDLISNCYREVQQADFLSASNRAYLCIWERFPSQS